MTSSGTRALPGVWSFASDRPGPRVVITGLSHGNEPAGLVAISRLLGDEAAASRKPTGGEPGNSACFVLG